MTNNKQVCKVCGAPTTATAKNCGRHAYVSERMTELAYSVFILWETNGKPTPDIIKGLALKHGCSVSTVYRYLRLEGFEPVRHWSVPKSRRPTTNTGA